MTPLRISLVAIALTAAGCASRATGVHPCDMPANGHIAAARAERSQANAHYARYERYRGAAGKYNPGLYELDQARAHERAARQHADAAEERAFYADACSREAWTSY
jgi:hypothetical protein